MAEQPSATSELLHASRRRRARRGRQRRFLLLSILTALVVTIGGTAWAMTRAAGPVYRLATAAPATVTQTVPSVGTIMSANQASLAFPVAGTVASVDVAVGDRVTAGQEVAALSPTTLQQRFDSAQAAVANAQQALAVASASQLSAATVGSSTAAAAAASATVTKALPTTSPSTASQPPSASGSKSGHTAGSSAVTAALAAVLLAQRTLTGDQSSLDAALRTVTGPDLQALSTGCAASVLPAPLSFTAVADAAGTISGTLGAPASVSVGTTTVTATPSGSQFTYSILGLTAGTSYPVTVQPTTKIVSTTACTTAIAGIVTALGDATASTSGPVSPSSVSYLAGAVNRAETALNTAVRALQKAAASSTSPTTSTDSGHGSASTVSTGATPGAATAHTAPATTTSSATSAHNTGVGAPGGGGSGSGAPASAQQMVADQAAIDAAQAQQAVAQQDLAGASMYSPIAGTVARVAIAVGDSVGAGSAAKTITVIGSGQKLVSTTIGIADLGLVKAGQGATVTVDGVSNPLSGTVGFIGLLNTSGTSGTTATYPVTISLDPTKTVLFDGAGADVAIAVGTASNVLSVPISALHPGGSADSVTVDSGGVLSTVRVTLGRQGTDLVQITSGLHAGQQVVLADVSAPIPSLTTPIGRRGFGLGKGKGGPGGGRGARPGAGRAGGG